MDGFIGSPLLFDADESSPGFCVLYHVLPQRVALENLEVAHDHQRELGTGQSSEKKIERGFNTFFRTQEKTSAFINVPHIGLRRLIKSGKNSYSY